MKKFTCCMVFSVILWSYLIAQQSATMDDGRKVVLYSNGTWTFQNNDPPPQIQVLAAGTDTPTASIMGGYMVNVWGKVRNNTDVSLSRVVFSISLYDKDGNLIDMQDLGLNDFIARTNRTISTAFLKTKGVPDRVEITVESAEK